MVHIKGGARVMKIGRGRVIKGIIISLLVIALLGGLSLREVYKNREAYGDKLIRFHVIANSDSPEDQSLKLQVRDKVIDSMNEKFKNSTSLQQSKEIILESLEEIESIAKAEARNNGSSYDINVDFGQHNFPTKSYGSFTLPAGEYEAVRIVIGEGKGENWWCVMFPPLCFIDMTNGLTDEKTKTQLANVLTEEEYNMITKAKDDSEVTLKLKFKIVEIFERSKDQLAKLFISQR